LLSAEPVDRHDGREWTRRAPARYACHGRAQASDPLTDPARVTSLRIEPLPGYTPTIGRLVGMITYARQTLVDAVAGLSRHQLDHLHDARSVGHEFLWTDFEPARRHHDSRARQQLELECDGITVLTLLLMEIEPDHLVQAIAQQTRFNERLGAVANARDYPSLRAREQFVAALVRAYRQMR
jgi:hypothetical protein